jgi:hypothetical protein
MSYKNIKSKISKTFDGVLYSIVAQPSPFVDQQGDEWPAAEIRKAAFNFMEQSRLFNREHTDEILPVSLVESWVTRDAGKLGDEEYLPGSWLIGIRVNDPTLLDQIQSGEYGGVSIEGQGIRE